MAIELKLFAYENIKTSDGGGAIHVTGTDLDAVKESVVKDLYNYRAPLICITSIEDGILQLEHKSKSIGTLDLRHVEVTLEYLYEAWGSPINLETIDSKDSIIHYTYDELGFSE